MIFDDLIILIGGMHEDYSVVKLSYYLDINRLPDSSPDYHSVVWLCPVTTIFFITNL